MADVHSEIESYCTSRTAKCTLSSDCVKRIMPLFLFSILSKGFLVNERVIVHIGHKILMGGDLGVESELVGRVK
jgi:hypothetical protein